LRFALTSVAWIVLASCLLYAGKTALNIYELRDAIDTTKSTIAADTQRYKSILEGLPKVNLSPENLRLLISRFDALQKRNPGLEPLLTHLSLALNENSRIELTRLAWKITDRLDGGEKAAEDAKRSGVAPAAAAGAASWMTIEIQAQLPLGLVTDQRAQIELIEGFATRLRDKQTDVRILSRPFDIESDKPLKSTGDRGEAQSADVPKFSLRIARPL
jgi:hypothetical protein